MALSAGTFYIWNLNQSVIALFEGNRFTVPSAVYSAPTELRVGAGGDRDRLITLLRELDYAPSADANVRTGEYRVTGSSIQVSTYGFRLSEDAAQAGRRLRIDFDQGAVSAILDRDSGARLNRLQLEPLLLGRFYGSNRETRRLVSFHDVSERFVPALLAAEDSRFFEHPGVDILGLARAFWVNLRHGSVRQGGSTITQQLVKNLWLTPERTYQRKFNEALLSLLLERNYGKSEILEAYANVIYLGQRGSVSIIGVGQASRHYFGKEPEELTWAESATLAGLIRAPAHYNPFRNPERSKARRDTVLKQLHSLGFLDSDTLARAKAEPFRTEPPTETARRAPYFVDYLSRTLTAEHDEEELQTAGLNIYSTLSAPLQLAAEKAVSDGLDYLRERHDLHELDLQAALISMEPHTGRIVAYVGGRDYAVSQFDRVSQARRQVGSLIKPFIYYTAVLQGHGVSSRWSNEAIVIPTSEGQWKPANYTRTVGGTVSMREALERSLNLPTVRIAMQTGLQDIRTNLQYAGVTSRIPMVPALALGALEVSPMEMANAYATLASLGERTEPLGLDTITDQEAKVLGRYTRQSQMALDPAASYLTLDMLKGVIQQGTGRAALRIGYDGDLAGKTGTTSEYRDAWFAGFTPSLVTVVWVGADDNQGIRLPGSTLALPIWGEYMLAAKDWYPGQQFTEPPGVEWVQIDPQTGERAGQHCPARVYEVFLSAQVPSGTCSLHSGLMDRIRNLFK